MIIRNIAYILGAICLYFLIPAMQQPKNTDQIMYNIMLPEQSVHQGQQ